MPLFDFATDRDTCFSSDVTVDRVGSSSCCCSGVSAAAGRSVSNGDDGSTGNCSKRPSATATATTIAGFDYALVLDDGGCAVAAGVDEGGDCSFAFWAFCRLVAGGGFVANIIVRMRRWAD